MKDKLLLAALAGLAVQGTGLVGANDAMAGKKKAGVKCWGINTCGGKNHECKVTDEEIKLANKTFNNAFKNSTAHKCAGQGKCGAEQGVLNWKKVPKGECVKKNGFMIVKKSGGELKIVKAKKQKKKKDK